MAGRGNIAGLQHRGLVNRNAKKLHLPHADDMAALEASCQLLPASDNPYSRHALPLQAAQAMEREGRLGAAALAYEAAARVRLPSPLTQAIMVLLY